MKRVILLLAIGCLCCACASTRNTSRSSAQERVEEQAESERQISTQEQAEEQRDVVTISKTTTETKSTTTINDTSSPAADSLGIPPPQQTTQRKRKPQTRRQPSINPLFVRSSTSNYAKPPTNKPRRTNRKTQARKRSKRIRHRRTCVGSASLQSAQPSSWDVFSYSVLSVENNLYLCTDVVLRHRALCGCCFGDPAFLQKLSDCCQIFFGSIRNLLNIWLVE